ncbi:tRNA N6-adenosine threonylcarbamoyltransferase [Sparganum proliferum]
MLRQDVAWFDRQSMGDLITKSTLNLEQIEAGIGDRLSRFLQNCILFVACFVTAFINGWKLTLVGLSTAPVIVLAFGLMGVSLGRFDLKENEAYAGANSIASEVFTAIRTVFAFVGQEKEAKRYSSELGAAAKVSIKKSAILGFSIGLTTLAFFASSGLTFWFGVREMKYGADLDSGEIVTVVLAFLVGSIGLGFVLPEFAFFTRATSAAKGVFHIIERVPEIDKDSEGLRLDELRGKIEFKNVSFAYPMRPDVVTLNNFSLKVQPGQTIAIVGPSGSGKSTSVQLLQRFYDCLEGEILIDGVDIRDLDIKWYRSQLGVVSQEPVLFSGTVAENIALGRPGATQEDIEKAAKMADVHDFILSLPSAYETSIAEGGVSISGGQKQRIAIARALIRDPKILLLDEATSALDTRSERAVQLALDRARTGRTVIMIAHRLTTVRDADKILVVDRGRVKETGTHDELVALNGIYAHMLSTQEKEKSTDSESEPDADDEEGGGHVLSKEEMTKLHVWMRSKKVKETDSVVSAATDSTIAETRTEEVGWFDRMENQPGILTARLATEVSSLELVTGSQLGTMLEAICLVIASLAITFTYSWALALVNIAFVPIMVGTGAFQMKHTKASIGDHEVMGSQVVQEALAAERTVFGLCLEDHFYERFKVKSAPSRS